MSETFTVAGIAARLVNPPPVYDPGGPVCLVTTLPDDANAEALTLAEREAAERGAVLIVVNCPHGGSQESVLATAGYQIASSWYVGPTHAGEGTGEGIREATRADIPRLLEIGEVARRRKAEYAPIFWRMAATPREEFGPYVTGQVENPAHVALVAEKDGRIVAYCIAQQDYVDDFTVEDLSDWPTVGVSLLRAASERSNLRGVASFVIVAPQAERGKCAAIESLGFRLKENWHTKPL